MNLSFLLYLACPVGMGVMMWMMMRGNMGRQVQGPALPPADLPTLRRQLESLEIQQRAIRTQMQRLSDADAAQPQSEPDSRLNQLAEASTERAG